MYKMKSTLDSITEHFYFLANIIFARLVNRPIILCFHRISQSSDSLLDQRIGTTNPELFLSILQYFKIIGYRFISLEELKNNLNKSKLDRICAITFDDGFKDLYYNAYPILKQSKIPFTLFLITSTVDSKRLLWLHKLYVALDKAMPNNRINLLKKYTDVIDDTKQFSDIVRNVVHDNSNSFLDKLASNIANEVNLSEEEERKKAEDLYLTLSELREMEKNGLSINAHGHIHLMLDKLSETETEQEIRKSVEYITQYFDEKPSFYCLPHNVSNQYCVNIIKNLGLKGIAGGETRLVKRLENPYSLPRIGIKSNRKLFYKRLSKLYLKAIFEK